MKPLAMTVLVHEGPMARAYLGALHHAGWQPSQAIWTVRAHDPAQGKKLAPWLPRSMRQRWARTVQDLQMNHWSRVFLQRFRPWCRPWAERVAEHFGVDRRVVSVLVERPQLTRYAQQSDEVLIDGLGDPALQRRLSALPSPTKVLFTGGGIVPAALLALPNCRFLHVHPGMLPAIRGADGLLWSMLVRGRPGATAFFLDQGLDTGDILLARDFLPPPMPAVWSQLDGPTRYRLLYAFVDPLLRAGLLLQWLQTGHPAAGLDPAAWQAQAQNRAEGLAFPFMHAEMRERAYAALAAPLDGHG